MLKVQFALKITRGLTIVGTIALSGLMLWGLSGCRGCEPLNPIGSYCPEDAACLPPATEGGQPILVDVASPDGIRRSRGECRLGRVACSDAGKPTCEGYTGPRFEACDNLDNDCDGEVDDHTTLPAPNNDCPTVGVCSYAAKVCLEGQYACDYSRYNQAYPEVCNGRDDDCDGEIDNGLAGTTFYYPEDRFPNTVGIGECSPGIKRCTGGIPVDIPPTVPYGEVCGDNLDNDCDGLVDESETEHKPHAYAIVLDVSGSMGSYLPGIISAVCTLASDPLFSDTQFALVLVASGSFEPFVVLAENFGPAQVVCDDLQNPDLLYNTSADEYLLEGIDTAADLDWPSGYPATVLVFGDETQQYWTLTEAEVADACTARPFRLGVFASPLYAYQWTALAGTCQGYVEPLDPNPISLAETLRRRFGEDSC